MNEFLKQLKSETNYTYTENCAITHVTTMNNVLDMFALGGAMRNRSEEDIILAFKKAYEEDKTLALRCLFYLRDARQGQGERRFFRVCIKWLANEYPEEMEHLIPFVGEYGRFDDLYSLVDTSCEKAMFEYVREMVKPDIKEVLGLDV